VWGAGVAGPPPPPAVGEAFRVVQFSVQNDHLHLIVEARDTDVLARGVQGLAIRLAKKINGALRVHGPVWADRFHARELTTPRAVRNALVYVLMNAKKHGMRTARGVDGFSSAPWFDGFARPPPASAGAPPVRAPRTWLAGVGWRRGGLVRLGERPRAPD
jgi:putative transposase